MWFTLLLLFVVVVGVVVFHVGQRSSRTWRMLDVFPGDYPLPLIGNAYTVGSEVDSVGGRLMDIWKRSGMSNFRVTLGSHNWILLCEPADIGLILGHPTELKKPRERNAAMMPFFGNSVSTSEGDKWRSTRKLMTPSFGYKTLPQRLNVVHEHGERLMKLLTPFENKEPVDFYPYIRAFMYDTLCRTLLGVDTSLIDELDHPYLTESGKVIKIVTTNYFSYWRHIRPIFVLTDAHKEMEHCIEVIKNNSAEIIKQRRKYLNNIADEMKVNNQNVDVDIEKLIRDKLQDDCCLLDDLIFSKLPNGDPLPDDMINEEIRLLTFTGHYTTNLTLSHTLYSMAKYPEVQRQVMEEQMAILGKGYDKKPTCNDLNEMKYLEAVIKETIRTIPTVTKIGRSMQNDMKLSDGKVIPAGTSVVIYYEALYKNPKVFNDVDKFIPERFFETLPNYAFMPFSGGPRNCIGFRYAWLAMKATISNIVRRFELHEGGPGLEPQFAHRITVESTTGLPLKLKTRTYS